jgi:exosortase E/protease (VPEID-CTERM system)
LFTPGSAVPPYDLALSAAWLLLAAATVLSLAPIAFQPVRLLRALNQRRALLFWGMAAGAAAFCAGRAAEDLWAHFGRWTLSCVAFLLSPFLPDLIVRPDQLIVGTPRFLVEIAPVCSGLEGIGLITAFVALYLATARDRVALPAGFVLFPVGIVAAWSANAVRIASLILVGSNWSRPLAEGGLHSKSGWLLFCAVAVGLVSLANRTKLLRREAGDGPTWNPAAAYLVPFVALAGTTLITAIPSHGREALYPLRAVAVMAGFWLSRRDRPPLEWSWSWQAPATGAAAFAFWTALGRLSSGAMQPASWNPGATLPHGIAALLWISDCLAFVVAIPLAYELAFRGYLLRRLASKTFTAVDPRQAGWIPVAISSVAYAAVTGAFWAAWPAGVLYAVVQRWRGRLGDAVLAHVVTNALLVGASAATGAPPPWSSLF